MKKIIATILTIVLFLLHLLRYNLQIINLPTEITVFDLLDNICWIIVFILLIIKYTNRFLISIYIFMISGALGAMFDEILLISSSNTPNDYIFLCIGLILVVTYNIIANDIVNNKVK